MWARIASAIGGWAGRAALRTAAFAADFLSRLSATFVGNVFAMMVRPALIVTGLFALTLIIKRAMDFYVGAYFIGWSVGGSVPDAAALLGVRGSSIAIYLYWILSLDRVIPFSIALLPIRLFWQRFTISL